MLSLEEIIKRILARRPEVTREAILQMLKEKREGAGRLLTDEGAAHMVASDLGVSVTNPSSFKTSLNVRDLIIGASDVSVSGRVALAYPSQSFQRRDGAQGRVGKFILEDETGSVMIVLWDEKAELLDQNRVAPGISIRVNHGYVRAGLDGRPEVNVGRRGSLVTEGAQGEPAKASSPMSRRKIGEISEKDLLVNIVGTVVSASTPSGFTRSDGTSGQIASLQVGDETGKIRVVLWNEKAEAADGISENMVVDVSHGRVRRGQTGDIEVHLSQSSELRLLKNPPKGVGAPRLLLKKIQDLKPGLSSVDVLARIAVLGHSRSFQRQFGGEGRVGDVTLVDETGSIRLSLWDDRVELLRELVPGTAILLKGAYTREGLGGSVALNLGRMGTITINPDIAEAKTLPQYSEETVPIGELRDGFPASVEGEVSEAPSEKQVTTRDGRELAVVSLRLRDETGEIGVSFWNENAEKARYLPLGARVKIRDAFVRIGYDGDLELSTRSVTKLEIITGEDLPSTGKLGAEDEDQRPIEGDSYQGEALLVEPIECRIEDVCPSCGGPLRGMSDQYVCNECGRVLEAQHNIVVEADLESRGKRLRAVFSGEDAEKLLGMKGSFAQNLVSQSKNDNAPLELARKKLHGQRLKLEGTVVDRSPTHFRVRVRRFERVGD